MMRLPVVQLRSVAYSEGVEDLRREERSDTQWVKATDGCSPVMRASRLTSRGYCSRKMSSRLALATARCFGRKLNGISSLASILIQDRPGTKSDSMRPNKNARDALLC